MVKLRFHKGMSFLMVIAILVTIIPIYSETGMIVTAATSDGQRNIWETYAEILLQDNLLNEEEKFPTEGCYFAISDLDWDGTPELIVRENGHILGSTDYYTYENGKAVDIEGPSGDETYPVYGSLYSIPSRGTYAFYRGGPAVDDGMPHTVMEYKLENHKIKLINNAFRYNYLSGSKAGENEYYLNGERCTAEEYQSIYNFFGEQIEFVPNSSANRIAMRVNNPCINNIYNGHAYSVLNMADFENINSWTEAVKYCEDIGGHMATISSQGENDFLYNYIKNNGYESVYFGFNDCEEEGDWKWVNGETVNYTNWCEGEPNNQGDAEHYAMFYGNYTNGMWNDGDFITGDIYFLCEWDNGSGLDNDKEETITTIRKSPMIQYNSYNVVKYADTDSGKVIKAAIDYNKAIEDYLSKLNKQASNDVKGSNNKQKSVGKKLMEKDKDIHTLTYVASEDYAIAAYEMLGQCYDEGIKKIDIGKIKITDDLITINSNIVKKIINSITRFKKTSCINGHTVHADILGAGGAITGTIDVDGIHFLVNSSYDKSTKIMNDYVNDLSDVVKDVLKQSLFSVLTELAHYTYIDQFAEDELKTLFNGKIDNLQQMGYGNLFKVLKGAKKTYNVVKKITAIKSTSDLKEALTIENLKEIYNELSDTDFSDDTIRNETVNSAYKNVIELKKALEDDLFNYIYGYKKEDEGVWQWIKRKININCPVDFTIRDADNNIVASIIDGVAKSNDSNIVLKLNGNEKVIYVLDERYINLQMTATDDGTMDIVIEDMSDGKPISRINYYDIKLTDENIYTQELNPDNISGRLNQFPIIYDKNKQINANDYFETTDDACINVKCTSSEGGYIENDLSETYVKGDPVELYAISFDEYIFEGWYIGDKLVEVSPLYRFTAKSDVSVQALFKKKEINYLTSLYDIEYGKDYDDFAWINIYDKGISAYDVELKMYGIDETDNDISTLNIMYKKGDITLSQKETIVLDENAEAYLNGILKKGYESITITDTEGNLVATLLSNGELPDIEILPTSSPSASPTATSTAIPTPNPFGGSSGGYIPEPAVTDPVIVPSPVPTLSPSQMPSPDPTAVPIITITPAPVQTPLTTPVPEITTTPLIIPEPSQMPEATLTPSASPVTGENNNTSSSARLKKGLKIRDKKTKAVYKITSMGKNKTVEYIKSTKRNTTDIVIPASVKLKGKIFKVLSIGKGAFKNNKKIKSVKIGKNIKVIGKKAFSGCKKLANVQMGKNINLIGAKAFNNCTFLTIITIPSKVKKIGKKAFYQCKNLQYILIKTKKLKTGNIGSNAFSKGYNNPRVKSDKSVWKQYQDAFISKGLSNKALFITNPVKLVV